MIRGEREMLLIAVAVCIVLSVVTLISLHSSHRRKAGNFIFKGSCKQETLHQIENHVYQKIRYSAESEKPGRRQGNNTDSAHVHLN